MNDNTDISDPPGARILFVHGRKPKPPPPLYRPELWRCLVEGVRRADPEAAARLARRADLFRLIAWHDLFYEEDRDIGRDRPGIERVLRLEEPTPGDMAEARSWSRRARRLAYHLADRYPWLMTRFADPWVRATVADTMRYLEDRDGLATQVRARVIEALSQASARGERLLVIGHSLGSVITYDALWVMTHELRSPASVDCLLTLGSPLGTRFIQRRLLGFNRRDDRRFPRGIRHWCNFATVGDLAALDPGVADDFRPMLEQGLLESLEDNVRELYGSFRNAAGLNVHRSYGYLVQAAVGRRVANWWRRVTDSVPGRV